jgi:hypothetical protein
MAERRLTLFHGGVPGLHPGNLIVPGHGVIPASEVYVTPSRDYAALYAHAYPEGDIYAVECAGRLVERGAQTYAMPEATVAVVVERGVHLDSASRRRIQHEDDVAWQSYEERRTVDGP